MTVTQQPTKKGITRRRLLLGLAAAIGIGGSVLATKNEINYLNALPENISALSLKGNKALDQSGSIYSDETYLEFRNTVFRLYHVQGDDKDNSTKLIRKTHSIYGQNLDPDSLNFARAQDLFNIVNAKAVNLDGLVDGEIKTFRTNVPATPFVRANYFYQVPVPTAHKSLRDVVAAYRG